MPFAKRPTARMPHAPHAPLDRDGADRVVDLQLLVDEHRCHHDEDTCNAADDDRRRGADERAGGP